MWLMKGPVMPIKSRYKRILPIAVPLEEEVLGILDGLKRRGTQKGYWVAEAIREKLERDGLLVKEPSA